MMVQKATGHLTHLTLLSRGRSSSSATAEAERRIQAPPRWLAPPPPLTLPFIAA